MSLIYYTREFANNDLSFDDLPNLDDGFLRVLVSARILEGSGHDLLMNINGVGPGHSYVSDTSSFQTAPTNQTGGNTIRLSTIAPNRQHASHLTSEITFNLMPGDNFVMARAVSSSFAVNISGSPLQTSTWLVSGGRAGASPLTSLGFSIRRLNGSFSENVSGRARLSWYRHYPNQQIEI